MTITTTKLIRAAGLSAIAGGLLFIAVQIGHPHLDATFATTTEYAVRETMKIFMAVLSLIGITGIYLRQVRQIGVLGLIGYVLFGVGYLAISASRSSVCSPPSLAPVSPATSTTSSRWPPAAARSAMSARCRSWSGAASPTSSAASSSASPSSGPTSLPGGPRCSSPLAPSRPSPPLAAGAHPTAARHSGRRRPHRPRLLVVAQHADGAQRCNHRRSRCPRHDSSRRVMT